MGPRICEIHGRQNHDALVSPKISASMEEAEIEQGLSLRQIVIVSEEKRWSYWVNEAFIHEFIPAASDKEIVLYDRSKKAKELRDRLLMRKIIKAMKRVCPACLEEYLQKSGVK